MSVVYQFGMAQLTKDLIFGWVIRKTPEEAWMPCNDLPSDSLEILAGATFPLYIPEDFKASIKEELERRKKATLPAPEVDDQVLETPQEQSEALKAAHATISRQNDRLTLMSTILEKMTVVEGRLVSDLDYVKLTKLDEGWQLLGRDRHHGDLSEQGYLIDVAVDRIMARWW